MIILVDYHFRSWNNRVDCYWAWMIGKLDLCGVYAIDHVNNIYYASEKF